jgi:hypothetical protein
MTERWFHINGVLISSYHSPQFMKMIKMMSKLGYQSLLMQCKVTAQAWTVLSSLCTDINKNKYSHNGWRISSEREGSWNEIECHLVSRNGCLESNKTKKTQNFNVLNTKNLITLNIIKQLLPLKIFYLCLSVTIQSYL